VPSPRAVSGAKYAGVPVSTPVEVSAGVAAACEMPKSVSFAVELGPASPDGPRAIRMLSGFTSRWTMPAAWAAASAPAIWAPIWATCAGCSARCSARTLPRLREGRYSSTSHGSPSSVTTSKIVTTFGWWSAAAIRASRIVRSRDMPISPGGCRSSRTCLIATSRPSSSSVARHTEPMPPSPTRSWSRYRPATTMAGSPSPSSVIMSPQRSSQRA
jgi:hypothetical protein